MPELDRGTARALTEAGYMPLRDYIRMYGAVDAAEAAADTTNRPATVSARPHRSQSLIGQVANPLWAAKYGVTQPRRRARR